MSGQLKEELGICDHLARAGDIKLLSIFLESIREDVSKKGWKAMTQSCSIEESEKLLDLYEKISAYSLIRNAFDCAESFYLQNDKRAARGWIVYAQDNAKKNRLDIEPVEARISEIRNRYNDKMPLFLARIFN